MTLEIAPWAIDGAESSSALARLGIHMSTSGTEGVAKSGAFKVTALSTPGAGFNVAGGGLLVRNRYLGADPDQTYVVRNVGTHVVDSSSMPAVNPSAKSHLVCITVGDPEFTQSGHPWMLATDPPTGAELTFQYVRVWVIPNVPSGTKTFKELGLNYPAYAIARLDMPAGGSVVGGSGATIVDLRKLARPRSYEEDVAVATASANDLNGGGGTPGVYENWPNTAHFDVDIPDWATRVTFTGFVEGAKKVKAGTGRLRIAFADGGASFITNIDEPAPAGASDREGFNIAGTIDPLPAGYAGTTRTIRMEGTPTTTASKGFLTTDSVTGAYIKARFEERAL